MVVNTDLDWRPTPPPRTREQRARALAKANASRQAASQKALRARLAAQGGRAAARKEAAAILLLESDGPFGRMAVYKFLGCVPSMAGERLRRSLYQTEPPIWPLRAVGDLTERQRRYLAAEIARIGNPRKEK